PDLVAVAVTAGVRVRAAGEGRALGRSAGRWAERHVVVVAGAVVESAARRALRDPHDVGRTVVGEDHQSVRTRRRETAALRRSGARQGVDDHGRGPRRGAGNGARLDHLTAAQATPLTLL